MEGDEIPCERPFLKNKWQLVHSIKAVLPDGQRQSMIGTIILTPATGTVHCILMSIEGIVLLDILYGQKVIVNRAIPPFDQPDIYKGLINDVRLLFLKPDGIRTTVGSVGGRSTICRYKKKDGMTIDVITHPSGNWEIKQYNWFDQLQRSVRADFLTHDEIWKSGETIPKRLELTASGFLGYKLSLDLIEAVPLMPQEVSE
jgi:hypothetical protein